MIIRIPALLSADRRGSDVFCGCQIHTEVDRQAVIHRRDSDHAVAFYNLLYRIEGLKSGMHHPDGVLWIRYPSKDHRVFEEKVPLVNVAPTLLDLFSIPAPEYMRGDSLLGSKEPSMIT